LVYFVDFMVSWHIFPRFGMLYQEKIWQPWNCGGRKNLLASCSRERGLGTLGSSNGKGG
jgi:hypothetical protein